MELGLDEQDTIRVRLHQPTVNLVSKHHGRNSKMNVRQDMNTCWGTSKPFPPHRRPSMLLCSHATQAKHPLQEGTTTATSSRTPLDQHARDGVISSTTCGYSYIEALNLTHGDSRINISAVLMLAAVSVCTGCHEGPKP